MKCPVCTGLDLRMAERQGIEIDYCPECRGIWLDRGELEKIIERSYSQANSYAQQPQIYQAGDHKQHYEKEHHDSHEYGRRKKSWLSELFD